MKRLLLPLLAAIALPTAVNAEIDKETAKFCLKAKDFAGCIETMTKDKIPPFQKQAAEEGLRTWTRDDGKIVRLRTAEIKAVNLKKKGYGRYLDWIYTISGDDGTGGYDVQVNADCIDYTAKYVGGISFGNRWVDLNDFEKERKYPSYYNTLKEWKLVMDEFCPQMNKLVLEAKERDRIKGIKEVENKSPKENIKVNCDSPVWKDKPRCN